MGSMAVEVLKRVVRCPLLIQGKGDQSILLETMRQYAAAARFVRDYGIEHEQHNKLKLHHQTYVEVRKLSQIGSQLVISARTKAAEMLTARHARGYKTVPRISDQLPVRYDQRSSTLWLERREISLATTAKRLLLSFKVPACFEKYLDWRPKSPELVYKNGKFFLLLVFEAEVEVPESEPTVVIGIDLGLKQLAVSSQNSNFYSGAKLQSHRHRLFRLKRSLQKKGTRGARRKLYALRLRQQRFQKDVLLCVTKQIVAAAPKGSVLVLEDLTHIRVRAQARRRQRRSLHSWPFALLARFLEYKALEKGIRVAFVDAYYTSQTCSECGHRSKYNRRSQSLFECQSCGYRLNADLNASRNIRDRYLHSLPSSKYLAPQAICSEGRAPIRVPHVASS